MPAEEPVETPAETDLWTLYSYYLHPELVSYGPMH